MKYIDKYNQIWEFKIFLNRPFVWRSESGLGLWSDGVGLKELITK